MRVHLVRKETIETYMLYNTGSRTSFEEFLSKLKFVDWEKPTDIKDTFSAADLLGKSSNRVIFDIGGNAYRMICKYGFGNSQVHLFVCWIGTHAEYTKLCNSQMQYTVSKY